MSDALPTELEVLRRACFVPCSTKEALHRWIKVYLGWDLPDCTVDADSTSTPMDYLWEVYRHARDNDDPEFSRVLAYAARDSFKCTKKGTKILCRDRGLVTIEEVVVGDVIWSGSSWGVVSQWVHDGVKEGRKVVLGNGMTLTGSPVHRVWTWAAGSLPGWKKLEDLSDGDLVAVDVNPGWSQPFDQDEYDVGYLCGILTGDGCLRFMGQSRVQFSNVDPFVLGKWRAACLKYAGKEPRQSRSKPCDWSVCSRKFCTQLQGWGMTTDYAWDKKIPKVCWTSRSYLVGFLSGILDTDGTVTKKKSVEFPMTSECLLQQMQVALASLGVYSRFRSWTKLYPGQKHRVHHLIVNGNDVPAMLDAGIILNAEKAQSKTFVLPETADAHDSIPQTHLPFLARLRKTGGRGLDPFVGNKPKVNYSSVSRKKVKKLVEWGVRSGDLKQEEAVSWLEAVSKRWSPVKRVEEVEDDFYDLSIPGDCSYWSDGLISHNTITASVMEVLSVVHLARPVAHMAAIEAQARKAQEYVKKFLSRPILRDYVVGDNARNVQFVRYEHMRTGESITKKQYDLLEPTLKSDYRLWDSYIQIVICSMQGANSPHVPTFVLDELDVVSNPKAYEEAKAIPSEFGDQMPITILTSSRKFSFGLVQKEIDEAAKTGLHVRHWNILDVTKRCPTERHRPDLPKIPIYRSDDTLDAMSEKDWRELEPSKQEKYVRDEGFDGCLSNCKLFAVCKGRLATHQTSESKLLKSVHYTQRRFAESSLEFAKAQLLCLKPSSEGLIYSRFDRDVHLVTPAQVAEMVTGEPYVATKPNFTKAELLALAKLRALEFGHGMDFGFSHCFSAVSAFRDHVNCFVFNSVCVPGLEIGQMVDVCEVQVKPHGGPVWPDTAYPAYVKLLRKAGLSMREWTKGPGSVVSGIEVVRGKLRPALGQKPQLYLLKGDEGCEALALDILRYHWKLDQAGKPTDQPDKVSDDACFTADTEVLTSEGWLSLGQVSQGDEVLAVSADGRGWFERPSEVIHRPFEGKVHQIIHPHLEFTATADHAHAVMRQIDWKVRHQYLLTKRTVDDMAGEMYWANNLLEWPVGDGYFPQGPDEAWFAGFWLAEGCFDSKRPSYLIVDQTKPDVQEEVRERLRRLGWTYSETKGQWSETLSTYKVRFVVSGQKERAARWRETFCSGAANKRLPVVTLSSMTTAERRELWEGYMAGDGRRTAGGWHFDSVSQQLIENIQILSMMLGYGCRVVSYDCMREGMEAVINGRRTCNLQRLYRGHVLQKRPVAHIQKSRVKTFTYSGDVHCVRTSTGFFLARTNGKPFVAGNCDALRYLVMNWFPAAGGKLTVLKDDPAKLLAVQPKPALHPTQWIKQVVADATGKQYDPWDSEAASSQAPEDRMGKRNGFVWSF